MQKTIVAIIILALLGQVSSKSKEQWASRTVYQVITDRFALGNGDRPPCDIPANTYCGGNFKGIQNNLDYIKDMGFDAIWISPIPDNYPDKYYGYAARNLYEVNDHFGSSDDLAELLQAMRDRDMWLMLDVVANHMGNTDTDYSQNVPFNNADNYHEWCDITDDCFASHNMECIQNCRLAGLADLKQENDWVAQKLNEWIHNVVNDYEIEGLRIDTVPEVPSWFWSQYSAAAGVFTIGEVFDGDMGYATQYIGPLDSVLNYPYFFTFKDIWITQRSMYDIRQFYSDWLNHISKEQLKYLGLFTDNHDNPRFMSDSVCAGQRSQEDCRILYKSITAMTLTSVGIPMIYYGTEQWFNGAQDPYDREPMWNSFDTSSDMYQFIKVINESRHKYQPYNSEQVEAYVDDDFYAFYRGANYFVAVTNNVNGTVTKQVTNTPFSEGQVVCNIFYPDSDCQTISGGLNVSLLNGETKIYVPKSNQKFLEQ